MDNALQKFRQQIVDHFTLDELQVLAFDLGLNWDELAGQILSEKTISLAIYLHKHNRLPDLISHLQQARPHLKWLTADQLAHHLKTYTLFKQPTDPLRQNFINRTRQTWIDGLLKNAVHHDIQLTLNKSYQRDAVSSFNPRLLLDSNEPIADDTSVLDIYEQHGRSLLILGAPASGKTIVLLQLAELLLDKAEADANQPMPAILNLSSWAGKQLPLAEWIVEELFTQQQTSRPLSQEWLQANQLALFLDGLDEVAAAVRDDCVTAINQFQEQYPASLVVCSRLEDYAELPSQLNLPTAIRLQPLTATQADAYLAQFGEPLTPLRHSLQQDADLQKLAQSPLMVSLMALAYDDDAPQAEATATVEDKQQALFARYSQRVFRHRPLAATASYSQAQASQWLTNLAHGLTQHNLSIFYIERLQPSWLPHRRLILWPYRLIASLIGGLTVGLIFGLLFELVFGGFSQLIFYLFDYMQRIGLIIGLIGMSSEKWFSRLLIWFSPSHSWRKLICHWLIIGLVIGLNFGLEFGDFSGLITGLIIGLIIGLIDAWLKGEISRAIARFIANLYQYLLEQYQQKEIKVVQDASWQRPTLPTWWQSIKQGSRGGLIIGLIIGLLIGLSAALNNILDDMRRVGLDEILRAGLRGAAMFVLWGGLNGAVIFGLLGGLSSAVVGSLQTFVQRYQTKRPVEPNQGIYATRRTLIKAGIPFTLIGAAIGSCTGAFLLPPIIDLFDSTDFFYGNWALLGLTVGLVGPLSYGGITLWRHFVLRWRLTRQGVLPGGLSDRQLIAYLDDMKDHLLLRRVGGGWVFIHRTLQEYFAAQHPNAGQPLPSPPPIPQVE